MKQSNNKNHSLPIAKSMVIFLIPIILANIIQSAGQIVGIIVVGKFLGVDSLAAISAFFPLLLFLVSSAIGIGTGSAILVGQSYGAGNISRLKEVVGVTLAFTVLISVVVAILGSIFTENMLEWIGTPKNILMESASYSRIWFVTLPITFIFMVYTTFIRGVGDSKTPFYFLVINVVLNISLLPIFIFGWCNLLKIGLNGAAYAAVLSNLLTIVLFLVYLHRRNHVLKLDREILKHFYLKGEILKALLRLALPSSIGMIALSMSEIAVVTFVNAYGSNATAAYGIVNQIASYVQIPAMSISIAISVFVSQSIGSGETFKIKYITRFGITLNYLLGGVLIFLVYVFTIPILKLFLNNLDTIQIAQGLILISFWGYAIFGHTLVVSSTMRATGTVMWPTIFTITSIWLVEVPTAYFLTNFTSIGINGIWLSYPISFIVNFFAQTFYYLLFWKKKSLKALLN
ncbi:MATE family efflux transporter [Bacillus sp. 165]|uniref:MATE family efflux transporter n=1 Tax=Bacillus sp. 165 TaxID=1529117 RepID=UPI001ADD0FBE|nr:MATE family efflux transporter [Bacillus sp. 165]MBO9129134.1 MATE family efflux transporter [Bacillus sp. 165]